MNKDTKIGIVLVSTLAIGIAGILLGYDVAMYYGAPMVGGLGAYAVMLSNAVFGGGNPGDAQAVYEAAQRSRPPLRSFVFMGIGCLAILTNTIYIKTGGPPPSNDSGEST